MRIHSVSVMVIRQVGFYDNVNHSREEADAGQMEIGMSSIMLKAKKYGNLDCTNRIKKRLAK